MYIILVATRPGRRNGWDKQNCKWEYMGLRFAVAVGVDVASTVAI